MRFSSQVLSEFYSQLGTMIQAGVPIDRALDSLVKSSPPTMRGLVGKLSYAIQGGIPFHESIAQHPEKFDALDVQTMAVSERSGAMDSGLFLLSRYYDNRALARRHIISNSMFPMVLLIAAVFIANLPKFVLGSMGRLEYTTAHFLRDTVGFLLMLVVGIIFVYWCIKSLFKVPNLNIVIDRILWKLPVIGGVRRDFALATWVNAIHLLLRAGLGIIETLAYATSMVNSPLIARAYEHAKPLISGQHDVSSALESSGIFPDMFIQFWATGEESGRLDEMLQRLVDYYDAKWQESLKTIATWLPRIAYACVSMYIIYMIFQLLGGMMSSYQEILK